MTSSHSFMMRLVLAAALVGAGTVAASKLRHTLVSSYRVVI
jgi:hypothetical protein